MCSRTHSITWSCWDRTQDSLIVQLSGKGNIVHKMCDMYKSLDFSELDNTSYFNGQLVKYYEYEVDKSKFPSLESFLNFIKKLPGPIFKDEHNGHCITEFVGLRPKMYCLIGEKHVVHNAAKGVPRNVVIDGKRMSVKNIDLYKCVVEAEKKEDAVIEGSFKRINNQGFDISTKEQTKTLMTCTDNKRWILDDNMHTLAFGHYRLKDMWRWNEVLFTLDNRAENFSAIDVMVFEAAQLTMAENDRIK